MINLRKNNMELKSKVSCYRRMIAQNEKKDDVSDDGLAHLDDYDDGEAVSDIDARGTMTNTNSPTMKLG